MARERIKEAVTASGSTESDKIIGNIDTIVGKISSAEELSVNNLENISKTLDASLLDTIVNNSNSIKEYAITQANMLMGITGYLLGNTGINKMSDFGSLKGSIKNTEPLFVSPTDTLKGLYDMLTEVISNTGISGGASGGGGTTSTLNIVLSSVDGGNLDSLMDLIKELQKTGKVENIEVLTAIQGLLKKLDKLGKTEVDTELISMKMDDVQLSMSKISEIFNSLSNLENRMKGIDIKTINTGFNTLSKFDFAGNFKNMQDLIGFINNVSELKVPTNIEALTIIEGLLKKLDKLGKMEVDTELISMKMDDVQLAMFNIGETFNELSNLERRMNGIDIKAINTGFNTLSKFDFVGNFKNMQDLIGFINNVSELKIPKNINKNISENTSRITEFIKVLVPFYTEMEKVPQVNYKRLIKNITNNVNRLPMLVDALNGIELKGFNKTKIKELQAFREVIYSFFYVLDDITYFEDIDIEDALDLLKDDVLPYFEGKNGLVDRISGLDFKKFNKSTIKQIINFSFAISSFGDVLKTISKMTPTMIWLTMTEDIIFEGFDLVYNMTYWLQQIVEQMKVVNKKAGVFTTFNGVMTTLVDIFKSLFKVSIFAMLAVGMAKHINKGIEILNLISTELENLNVSDIKDKQEIVHSYKLFIDDLLSLLIKVPLVGIFGLLAVVFEKPLTLAISTLKKITDTINENLEISECTASIGNIKAYASVMKDIALLFPLVTIGGILAAPAILGGLLMTAAIKVLFKTLGKSIESIKEVVVDKKTEDALKSMLKIILVVSGLMLVAALTGGILLSQIVNVFGFLSIFLIFLTSITLVITLIGGLMTLFKATKAVETISTLGSLIATLATVMMVGALFMLTGLWKEALLFGATLAGFIFLVMIPFTIMSIFFKNAIKGAKEISILIVTCTLVMMLGAVFMLSGLHWEALKFGLVLAAFIALVMLPFIFFGGRRVVKSADAMVKLIITCTIILTLGAFLMMIPGFAENATDFAWLLGSFIVVVVAAFGFFGKRLKQTVLAMFGLMLLMVVATSVLLIGALFIEKHGAENPIIFATILDGMIVILVATLGILSTLKDAKLLQAALAMVIISVVIAIGAASMVILGVAFKQFGDWKNALAMASVMTGMIVAFAIMANVIGGVAMNPLFWAGIGAVAAITGIILMISIAFKTIAEALTMMVALNGKEIDEESITPMIDSFINIAAQLERIDDDISPRKISKVADSMTAVGRMISILGISVQDVANLKVATEWDSDGNPISYRQLNADDFKNAAENTKEIITTLGGAIIQTYNDNPHLFEEPSAGGIIGFFGGKGKTPFDIVVRSCTGMGKMISVIGKSVADISNLTVATSWDSDGNPISFRQLDKGDFEKAAVNTKEIIETLGGAIIKTYNDNPDLFVEPSAGGIAGFFGAKGKTPFDIVVRSCTGMGNMISVIGKSIADISNLTVATKWNAEGTPIEFRQLGENDFKQAASNIKEIVTTLGGAITTIYKENKELFDVPPVEVGGLFFKVKVPGTGKTPFEKVVVACTAMGGMISSIANGVKDMADLKVATKWDSDGNAIEWRHLEKDDFTTAADRVGEIVTTIGNKLAEVYSADTAGIYKAGLTFKDGQLTGGDIPAIRVLNAASLMGTAMSSIAGGVKDMADLRIEAYDKDGKPTGTYITLGKPDFTKAAENTSEVVSCLTIALNDVYAKYGHMFDEVVTYTTTSKGWGRKETHKHVSDAPIVKVLSSAGNIGTFVSDCAAAVKAMADLSFIDSRGERVKLSLTKDLGKTGTVAKNIEAVVTCVAQALINLYDKGKDTYFNPDYKGYDNIQNSFNKIKNLIDTAQKTIATIQETVESVKNIPKLEKSWTNLLNALLNPVNDAASKINASQQATQISNLRKQADNARSIITEINNLNTHKVDKFIELSKELKDLSINVGDMSGVIEALNGKINDTLNTVSERLIQSVAALEKSDKAQEKRNKMIKENTAELKKVLETPLTITVKTEDEEETDTGGTNSTGSPSPAGGGEGEGSGDIGTPAANCDTGSISSDDFESLASTASAILGILKSHFGVI